MVIASQLSEKMGYLAPKEARKIESLLKKLKLPVRLQIDHERLLDALRKDKKRSGGAINFVLLKAIGHAVVEEVSINELGEAIRDFS